MPQNVLVQVCSDAADKYRFGFNGQEKDNEIAGLGNHNTALFWQYDTRTGRRWNKDPVIKSFESVYSTFSGNPVLFTDYLGDDIDYANDQTRKIITDLVNKDSKNYNPRFDKQFRSLEADRNSVFTFELWQNPKGEVGLGKEIIFGEFTADEQPDGGARNEKGQNLLRIGFSMNIPSYKHTLGPLFEETDHAVQFQEGRIGMFKLSDGKWGNGGYDIIDEIDNKISKFRTIKSFSKDSKYTTNLYAEENKIYREYKKGGDYYRRIGGMRAMQFYQGLSKTSIDVFQGAEQMTNLSAEQLKQNHKDGIKYSNILIGTPQK